MRFFQALLVAALAGLVASGFVTGSATTPLIGSSRATEESYCQQKWTDFKVQYSKKYASPKEEGYRFQVFKDNMLRAAQLNLDNPEATFGVSPFIDLTPAEFKRLYLGYRPEFDAAELERVSHPVNMGFTASSRENVTVDWRAKGAVTPVRNQNNCNAGWAFSTIASVESAYFLKHGTLPTLSPQQVLSCDMDDNGCTGGALTTAFTYIKNNGLEPEVLYPFNSGSGIIPHPCSYSPDNVIANITSFTYATPPCTDSCTNQDEALLLNNLVSTGPFTICVNAMAWQYYVSGVITSPLTCPFAYNTLDHCAQLVGYQTASPSNYWIVRNNWGISWGIQGYVYLAYGKNVCGVADEAIFPTSA